MSMENMAMKRRDEAKQDDIVVPIRSERLFLLDNYWYFRTREGMQIGPFDSSQEATEGINGFIDFLNNSEEQIIEKVSKYTTNAA